MNHIERIYNQCPNELLEIKCPYFLIPETITIHETANDASAANEIRYMQSNSETVSFHFAVDDQYAVQGLPLDRNAWHAGDGRNGPGNRKSIAIEICFSKFGGPRYEQARLNAAELAAELLKTYKLPLNCLKKHQDWSGKLCPHRMLKEGRWDDFTELVKKRLQELDSEKTELKDGYQCLSWQNQTLHVYKQGAGQEINLVSAAGSPPERALQSLELIEDLHHSACKINANYFEMQHQEIYGQHYGVEISAQLELAPKQKEWLAFWIDLQNQPHYCTADEFWLTRKDVKLALSPAAVLLWEGQSTERYSQACGHQKITEANTQSLLLQLKEGRYAFAVVSGRLNLYQCRDWAKSIGAVSCIALDSGGSSQMIADGRPVVVTGRKLPNALTFTAAGKESETIDSGSRTMIFRCRRISTSKGYPLRDSAPSGKIISYLQAGDQIKVVDIRNKGRNQYTSDQEPWCLTDTGFWFAFDRDYFE